jgi:hypothetical protein
VSGATISEVHLAAAHDGDAELLVTLAYPNGGRTQIALDEFAVRVLMASTSSRQPEELIGAGWEPVRDALIASSNRFMTETT